MNSREAILRALRRNAPPHSPLPEPPAAITYPDLQKQFEEAFTSVGGRVIRVATLGEIQPELRKIDAYASAQRVASLVPGVDGSTVEVGAMNSPHELEGLQLAIVQGALGAAENGAVWVPGSSLGPHRAIFVVAEHLVLVLGADRIVSTMHEAYEHIQVERPGFGLFISGPSKTADIEQSLVIGAHGPRSCTLFLVG